MITIRMTGGIGNQLFQYALGLHLKEVYQKEVQFDTSFYNINGQDDATIRDLDIESFTLGDLQKNNSSNILSKSVLAKGQRFLERLFVPYYRQSYFFEQTLRFDPNVFKVKNSVYLDGYWQSPEYFKGIEGKLRSQFVIENKMTEYAAGLSKRINDMKNAISIHIRRSDYLNKYSHVYYSQPISYYLASLKVIKGYLQTDNIKLIVFSDDIEWCRTNLDFKYPTIFVDALQRPSYEDMILMSQCSHHIIANSTYSWWGAWLNKNDDKIVVAPKNWFLEPYKNEIYTQSIIPSSWIRL
jgi:hypothetical protein